MTELIFDEIRAECKWYNEKWDKQNHPMLGMSYDPYDPYQSMKEQYPKTRVLEKTLCNCRKRIETDDKGWFDILFEKVCEAFLETEPERQRAKMLQVAAVAVQIIECLDIRVSTKEK